MSEQTADKDGIRVPQPSGRPYFRPLQTVEVQLDEDLADGGPTVHVLDGEGREYHCAPAERTMRFQIGGSLGWHAVMVRSGDRLLGQARFKVDCRTSLDDGGDWPSHLLQILRYSVSRSNRWGKGDVARYNGRLYTKYAGWLYDHVAAAMGAQYYRDDFREAIDLFAAGQREDGMIYSNYKHPYSHTSEWEWRFGPDFVKVPEEEDSSYIFVRVPLENSEEYMFIEGVYRCWKATGDTEWMKGKLDNCLKAVEYATTDPYRWSEKYQMMRKGYSIDMWDFQSKFDSALVGGDIMLVTLEDTHFNIFYGDNGHMAQSCHYLAEMLTYVGRNEEAREIQEVGGALKERIDELSWTGTHYIHMVPEEPDAIDRDFGVDTDRQVSLHNAWLLNRGMTQEQCRAVIETYRRIRREMPRTSPGEWYTIYPPFERGWNGPKWEYMNGSVTGICAGELARGALEHGFETYGVDILRRVHDLAGKTGNLLDGGYNGAIVEEPDRSFTTVSLGAAANTDFRGTAESDAIGWSQEGENDLRNMPTGEQSFHGVPFDVIDPEKNDGRACIGIAGRPPYASEAELPVGRKAASLYLLHTKAGPGLVGRLEVLYEDGSEYLHRIAAQEINGDGPAIGDWWHPSAPEQKRGIPTLKVAWRGHNPRANDVGVYVYGLNNPHPEKTIEKVRLRVPEGETRAIWWVLGLTLSDTEVYFRPSISCGMPRNWSSGEMMYGLFEGLIGVQDTGVGFDRVRLVPRWEAADKDEVEVVVRYAACDGYVSYRYRRETNPDGRATYRLTFSGNAREMLVELLLPEGGQVQQLTLNGKPTRAEVRTVEESRYAVVRVGGSGVHSVVLRT